jgi:hypothetical protein
MLLTSLGRGVRAIFAHVRIAIVLWLINVALASVAIFPIWWWWSRTALLPETDPLVERFHVGVFRDLLIDGGILGLLTLPLMMAGLLLVALPISVFLAGATLEVLISDDGNPFFQRFVRGGAHFFWRFLRLSILGGIVMIVVVALTALGTGSAVAPLLRSTWAPGAFVAVAIEVLAVGMVTTYFLLSFDYARIRLALSDRRGVFRAWMASLGLVARHPVQTYGLACMFGILFAAVAAGYLLAVAALGTHTMALIAATMALQQVFVLARTALRVGMLAGEMEMYQWLRPAAAQAGDFETPPPMPAADARIDLTLAQ